MFKTLICEFNIIIALLDILQYVHIFLTDPHLSVTVFLISLKGIESLF